MSSKEQKIFYTNIHGTKWWYFTGAESIDDNNRLLNYTAITSTPFLCINLHTYTHTHTCTHALCAVAVSLGGLATSGYWMALMPSFPSLAGYEVAFQPFAVVALVAMVASNKERLPLQGHCKKRRHRGHPKSWGGQPPRLTTHIRNAHTHTHTHTHTQHTHTQAITFLLHYVTTLFHHSVALCVLLLVSSAAILLIQNGLGTPPPIGTLS